MEQGSVKRRVIIVDDNRGFRLAAEAFLRTLPWIELAGVAANGEQGIELASALCPDVAIVDINMPGLNGFEVASRLRALQQALGIVLVSLNVDQATRSEAYRRGADAVVAKADLVSELPAMLEASFRTGAPRAAG